MGVQPGQMLLHYRLVEKIGEGGMGQVWRAQDATLDRSVAIKILPDSFADDPDRLARFEREARLLASLNHPNIAGVHGLHEADGLRFLAMELIDGEDLERRLTAGPLQIEDALRVALQVTHALEAAHESGVIHRDLKPANVQLTPDGTAKVLDFGLAKTIEVGTASGSASESVLPTMTSAGTRAGVILGTAAYMSPEQARGKPVDRRTDIWSFGCLVYELLTGRKTFGGDTSSDLLASILKEDPDWTALPATTPRRISRLLQRCLQRDPLHRLRDIGDARIELEEILAGAPDSAEPAEIQTSRLPWIVAAVALLVAAVAGWTALRPGSNTSVADLRLSVPLPADAPLSLWGQNVFTFPSIAISPRGDRIAYVASVGQDDPTDQLYVRSLDDYDVVALTGTENATNPAFSPDGDWIAFTANNKLKKIAVSGGIPIDLADIPGNAPGVSWGDDETIAFSPRWAGGVWRVSAAGGAAEQITYPDQGADELGHRWPQLLPGGKHVIYSIKTAQLTTHDEALIGVTSLETGESRVLVEGGFFPRYAPSGHLVYGRDATLYTVPFDLQTAEVRGTPAPKVDGVITSPVTGVAHFAVSDSGTLIYLPGQPAGLDSVPTWYDRQGVPEPLPLEPGNYVGPIVSPDGRRLVVNITAANDKLWVYEFDRGTLTRLTAPEANDASPLWSPDSRRVFYCNDTLGSYDIYSIPTDGSAPAELLLRNDAAKLPSAVSSDGKRLLFTQFDTETSNDIWVLPLDPAGDPEVYLQTPSDENSARFAPNGEWVAYISNESGRGEIYARPYPGPGGKIQLSVDGGKFLAWAHDGSELFYATDDAVMVVPIEWSPGFRPGRARRLFEFDNRFTGGLFDLAPDGKRFLMVPLDGARATRDHLRLELGWADRL